MPMTKDEAITYLEEHDICLKHFQRFERSKTTKRLGCLRCEADDLLAEDAVIEQCARILRGEPSLPPTSIENAWNKCQTGSLPPDGERVWFLCTGFVEKINRSGGKENLVVGKPQYWKVKSVELAEIRSKP